MTDKKKKPPEPKEPKFDDVLKRMLKTPPKQHRTPGPTKPK